MTDRQTLRIFLASPSDVTEEREAVDQIVREVNDTLSPSSAARLELLRWETHTVPDLGGTDAQEAVTRQLGDDFDVFLGILWTRFGTPTLRARSGTEEEFRRALDRKRESPGMSILFYFKKADLPHDVDLDQVRLVRDFRASIQDQGLIRDYDTVAAFQQNVRMALTRFALGAHVAPDRHKSDRDTPSRPETRSEDAGLYDLVDQANESLDAVTAITKELTKWLEQLGERATHTTEDIESLDIRRNPEAAKGARRIVNSYAEFMSSYAAKLEEQLPPFREGLSRAFAAIQGLAEIAPDFGESALQPTRENLTQVGALKATMITARTSLGDMRVTIQRQPRVTTLFNRSKRRLVAALQDLDQEMASAIGSAGEAAMLLAEVVATLEREQADSY